jgi:hypothetical protein
MLWHWSKEWLVWQMGLLRWSYRFNIFVFLLSLKSQIWVLYNKYLLKPLPIILSETHYYNRHLNSMRNKVTYLSMSTTMQIVTNTVANIRQPNVTGRNIASAYYILLANLSWTDYNEPMLNWDAFKDLSL